MIMMYSNKRLPARKKIKINKNKEKYYSFSAWDLRLTGSDLFVLMSQWENNNELALQHGGFCTM